MGIAKRYAMTLDSLNNLTPGSFQSAPSFSPLDRLEAQWIHILREAVAEAENPVLLFSAGKDSTVLAHLACRWFYLAASPLPLLHIDSTWEFRSLLEFRDRFAVRQEVSRVPLLIGAGDNWVGVSRAGRLPWLPPL